MSDTSPVRERLDSWKAIAEYLRRDLATVRRWEKSLGLPVRRVAGAGRSVFAYTAEIDAWLQAARPVPAAPDADAPATDAEPVSSNRAHFRWWVAVGAVVALVAAGLLARDGWTQADDLRIEVTHAGVIARDAEGVEQWRHPFPATHQTSVLPEVVQVTGARPGVYFATSTRGRETLNDEAESGALTFLDPDGHPQGSFTFHDQVTFHGTTYGAPWALMAFAVDASRGARRIALAAHHHVWDPGLVTILDERWQRHGTFVHAGWIEGVRWMGPDRLLIAGFSNAHDGGMVALLDSTALDGQGPEPAGSTHFCENCGSDRPLRMFVFPRSELNRVTASRFNRAIVQTFADGHIVSRTVEIPSSPGDAVALYEFTPSLDLVSAKYGERYWEMHRALEAEGRITHTREQCPDRDGPRAIKVWEPASGWRVVR